MSVFYQTRAGISIKESDEMLAQMYPINVEIAAENIRKVINSMGTPTKKAAKRLRQFGIMGVNK